MCTSELAPPEVSLSRKSHQRAPSHSEPECVHGAPAVQPRIAFLNHVRSGVLVPRSLLAHGAQGVAEAHVRDGVSARPWIARPCATLRRQMFFRGVAADGEAEFALICDGREITGDGSEEAGFQQHVTVEPEKSRYCNNQAGLFPDSTVRTLVSESGGVVPTSLKVRAATLSFCSSISQISTAFSRDFFHFEFFMSKLFFMLWSAAEREAS